MNDTIRPYRQRKRADNQAETRRRITEAAVDLHGSVGPVRTTVSAIADRAGVQRATVYRHFPDDRAILAACSAHYRELHPAPDPAAWADIPRPDARLRAALDAFYAWYEDVEPMLANIVRDAPLMEEVGEVTARRLEFQASVEQELAPGWGAQGRALTRLRATLSLAFDFSSWRLLHGHGLSRSEQVEAMARAVEAAAHP